MHRVCWQPSPEGEPLGKREENGTSRVHGVIQDFIGGVLDHKSEDDGDIISAVIQAGFFVKITLL